MLNLQGIEATECPLYLFDDSIKLIGIVATNPTNNEIKLENLLPDKPVFVIHQTDNFNKAEDNYSPQIGLRMKKGTSKYGLDTNETYHYFGAVVIYSTKHGQQLMCFVPSETTMTLQLDRYVNASRRLLIFQ